jgi:hypothetical protein
VVGVDRYPDATKPYELSVGQAVSSVKQHLSVFERNSIAARSTFCDTERSYEESAAEEAASGQSR